MYNVSDKAAEIIAKVEGFTLVRRTEDEYYVCDKGSRYICKKDNKVFTANFNVYPNAFIGNSFKYGKMMEPAAAVARAHEFYMINNENADAYVHAKKADFFGVNSRDCATVKFERVIR